MATEKIEDLLVTHIAQAWDHANHNRQLSLQLSISNIAELMEMRGDGNIREFMEESDCGYKDRLAAVSEYLGLNWQSHDSGVWNYPLTGVVTGPPNHIPPVKFVEYT